MPTLEQIASQFRCTPEQVKKQFRLNREQLLRMAAKADRTRKTVNGYSAEQLRNFAAKHFASNE